MAMVGIAQPLSATWRVRGKEEEDHGDQGNKRAWRVNESPRVSVNAETADSNSDTNRFGSREAESHLFVLPGRGAAQGNGFGRTWAVLAGHQLAARR